MHGRGQTRVAAAEAAADPPSLSTDLAAGFRRPARRAGVRACVAGACQRGAWRGASPLLGAAALAFRPQKSLTLVAHVAPCQTLRAAGSVRAVGRGKLTIRAARVAGVEIPNQKRLETALTCARACAPQHSRLD